MLALVLPYMVQQFNGDSGDRKGTSQCLEEEEEEEDHKLLPADKADHLCQLWQSCSDLHKI